MTEPKQNQNSTQN